MSSVEAVFDLSVLSTKTAFNVRQDFKKRLEAMVTLDSYLTVANDDGTFMVKIYVSYPWCSVSARGILDQMWENVLYSNVGRKYVMTDEE